MVSSSFPLSLSSFHFSIPPSLSHKVDHLRRESESFLFRPIYKGIVLHHKEYDCVEIGPIVFPPAAGSSSSKKTRWSANTLIEFETVISHHTAATSQVHHFAWELISIHFQCVKLCRPKKYDTVNKSNNSFCALSDTIHHLFKKFSRHRKHFIPLVVCLLRRQCSHARDTLNKDA